MKKILYAFFCPAVIFATVTAMGIYTHCQAQQEPKSALQISIKSVSVLPFIEARYKTMKLIPSAEYQSWRMDAGGSFSQQVVDVPDQKNGIFIEVLAIIKNAGSASEKFAVENPKLKLNNRKTIEAWEYLIAGLVNNYDGVVNYLKLTNKPSKKDDGTIHLSFGSVYSNLESSQQTWVILIFQVPKETGMAKLIVGDYSPVTIKIPIPRK